jgi:hypothetical protein
VQNNGDPSHAQSATPQGSQPRTKKQKGARVALPEWNDLFYSDKEISLALSCVTHPRLGQYSAARCVSGHVIQHILSFMIRRWCWINTGSMVSVYDMGMIGSKAAFKFALPEPSGNVVVPWITMPFVNVLVVEYINPMKSVICVTINNTRPSSSGEHTVVASRWFDDPHRGNNRRNVVVSGEYFAFAVGSKLVMASRRATSARELYMRSLPSPLNACYHVQVVRPYLEGFFCWTEAKDYGRLLKNHVPIYVYMRGDKMMVNILNGLKGIDHPIPWTDNRTAWSVVEKKWYEREPTTVLVRKSGVRDSAF